ncbi:pantoate--beta-alanine ligase [Parastagonospora nodorum]|uniref:Pantoate--beta-alanine ligase n=1 Tax=Phaeosphaeria nodorum (strain SN15 / ATCC MYA-4574 / FGSC 10173) TaxID=321614 RepID=A0A7U2I0Q7_PHANO|nr:pantoate--beta-alanine ligase [Parastagonospora nodorum]QRC97484.1 pantoate--beta-alanine ligase Pbl1 [Parastagonospora nodorum SN15]KAH3922970.1 pantoate--beta-alanine ligase [Parastagonospora nodorum]KAH4002290.1 pantoate--beta-alanine ligase [Parastagonospora nodorum]KAH4017921.1 pantoate--beta-alanine ligase [Parastagonospora nodorum]
MALFRQTAVSVPYRAAFSNVARLPTAPSKRFGARCLSTTLPLRNASTQPGTQVFHDVAPLRQFRRGLLLKDRTVGLVPTMGALHEGHLSLIRHAAAENTDVFVTVYVNPTQFGLNEDLASYPKTWDADMQMLRKLDQELASASKGRVSAVFAPSTKIMYPTQPPDSSIPGVGSFIEMRPLGQLLEGASRPVFFRGVATVCMKLFNICAPERVYFGQKDVQQTAVIRKLIKDFHLNMDLRIIPTSREADGLALSSRNVYLGARRRAVGIVLNQALRKAEAQYKAGKRLRGDILWPAADHGDTTLLEQEALAPSRRAKFQVDYISLADPDTMEEVDEVDDTRGAVLSGAVKMLPLEEPQEGEELGVGGGQIPVRLIDNIVLDPVK